MPFLALVAVAIWFVLRPPAGGPVELAAAACAAAFGLTPVARLIAIGAGALDHPDGRKTHALPTPRLGGVAVMSAVILVIGRRVLNEPDLMAITIAALVLMAAGAVDDVRGLSARTRLALQIACAGAVMAAGVRLHIAPGPAGPWIDGALTMIWIVGLTNAYNFIDGMDGLAASLGALLSLLLGVVVAGGGSAAVLPVTAALCGALLGFLPHNLRPGRRATIFLGDSGSASIGFMLAALAIAVDWADGDPLVALAAPVLLFSVLIYDMIQTTVARIASGRVRTFRQWIDYTGRDHVHHRFAEVLGGRHRALVLILVLALALGLSAIGLRQGTNTQALLFLFHGTLILVVVEILIGAARRGRVRAPGTERG